MTGESGRKKKRTIPAVVSAEYSHQVEHCFLPNVQDEVDHQEAEGPDVKLDIKGCTMFSLTPNRAKRTNDQEFILPTRKTTLDVPNAISQQATARDAKSVCRVPDTYPKRLLSSSVPHRCDEHKGWVRACFCCTRESTQDCQLGESFRTSLEHHWMRLDQYVFGSEFVEADLQKTPH